MAVGEHETALLEGRSDDMGSTRRSASRESHCALRKAYSFQSCSQHRDPSLGLRGASTATLEYRFGRASQLEPRGCRFVSLHVGQEPQQRSAPWHSQEERFTEMSRADEYRQIRISTRFSDHQESRGTGPVQSGV